MTKSKKTWAEKLAGGKPAHVVVLDKPFAGVGAGQTLAIASPQVIQDYVNAVPHGQTRTMQDLRRDLARHLGADATCPTSSSIFLRIVAEAALEDIAAGAKPAYVTPFWRVVDPQSPLARRLSCGPDFVLTMREMELPGGPAPAAPRRKTAGRA